MSIERLLKMIVAHLVFKDFRGVTTTLKECKLSLEQQQSEIERLRVELEDEKSKPNRSCKYCGQESCDCDML